MRQVISFLVVILTAGLLSACRLSEDGLGRVSPVAMVRVPAGMFTMGSDAGPPSSRPAHQVYLSEFEIAGTEVTNGQYLEYVHASGDEPLVWRQGVPALDPRQAVTGILWNEADAFCQWYGWRLPTEAEWEKAARGTDQRTFPWGDNWDPAKANTVESGNGGVVQVASYPEGRSPYGLLDMTGNAQEWVADYFDPTYYLQSPLRDPAGTEQVLDHGLRGGSWAAPLDQATTFFRDSSHSVRPNARVGFRCAADPRDS